MTTTLQTPDGQEIAVFEWDTDEETSIAVMRLLIEGHEWVAVLDGEGEELLRYVVLERNAVGFPVQIGSEETFGDRHSEILTSYPDNV